jgi:hypothetical protein
MKDKRTIGSEGDELDKSVRKKMHTCELDTGNC